jgi:predicted hotdog family 3-hydroxylacyl-ACP dehydratase
MTDFPPDLSIQDLLPHRGRMLLIDEIVHIEGDRAVAAAYVTEQWPLLNENIASPLMLIELVAQASGLSNGLNLIKEQGKEVDKSGWVVGIKRASFDTEGLSLGDRIVVEANNRFKFDDFVEIEGFAQIGDRKIGEVTLQVMKANME